MGALAWLGGRGAFGQPTFDPTVTESGDPLVDALSEQLRAVQDENLLLQESLVDAEMAFDDRGWRRLGSWADNEFTREGLRRAASLGRTMVVTNTLIRRGVALRTAYIWGGGVQLAASDPDVNAVVQAFVDDPGNRASLTGEQAHEENERTLASEGNVFVVLYTAPRTGRVQARTVPFDEIADVICNPDDRDEPWYYERRWTARSVLVDERGARTVDEERREWYPDVQYRPVVRPRYLDGDPVNWDSPVIHVSVNRLDGWKFGVGDVYTALPWARAYREFLADWAQLVKALSQFAFRLSSKGNGSRAERAARTVLARTQSALASQAAAGGTGSTAGATVASSDSYQLEAIPKTGATIDSESGRPLAAMVAAGLDVPVTMLLGDPGVTGARATAETLDTPMRLAMQARRHRWAEMHRTLAAYIIREAVRAPGGALRGSVLRDEVGREVVSLAGDADAAVSVDWPSLEDVDAAGVVASVVAAKSTNLLPPLVLARLLLQAFDVDDVDEVIGDLTDAAGNWIGPDLPQVPLPPGASTATPEAIAAAAAGAQEALRAILDGDYPVDRL